MSQHDFVIDDQAGLAFLADLNAAFVASVSNSSGPTAPSTTYPHMWWVDTASDLLKRRNAGNTAWIDVMTLTQRAAASGTLDASGVVGTATNDNAVAGKIGEFKSVAVLYASSVSLSSGFGGNITSLILPAGDWDVSGVGSFDLITGPSQYILASISTTSSTSGPDGQSTQISGSMTAGYTSSIPTPIVRLSLASTTTVYLVVKAGFSGGTMQSWGFLRARRVR